MLPKTAAQITNGGIYVQRVRCGKSNCKCSRGVLHTGHYFFTRRNRKLIKSYIRKADLVWFSLLLSRANAERKKRRKVTDESLRQLKGYRLELKDTQALINSLRT